MAESFLGRRPGVIAVDANPVAQTATVEFDPTMTSVTDLQQWVEQCGYHCAGESVPTQPRLRAHGAAGGAKDGPCGGPRPASRSDALGP